MLRVQNEAKLREAIELALRRLREGAQAQVPGTGDFPPVRAHFVGTHLLEGVGNIEFRVGSASSEAGERERFLEVRVSTASGGSESSVWIFYGASTDLMQALQSEASLFGKARTAILEGAQSLLRHELP